MRHAPLVPFPAMLHKPGMATTKGDVEKDGAPSGAWRSGLHVAARMIIDYALPPRCPGCGVVVGEDRQFCLTCWSSLDFLDGPSCSRCSIPLPTSLSGGFVECGACLANAPPFEGAPAAVAYGPVARTVALRLKYARRTGHARLMARLMARQLNMLGDMEAMLLVPVPLQRWRLWSRGFNQAALVVDELSRLTGVPHDHHLLLRAKPTASLRGKGRRERERIVAGAFALAADAKVRAAGRHLVLVDDVHASGATLRAAARLLGRLGTARVSALTWARVVPEALMTGNIFDFASLDSDMTDLVMTG
nr:ComF family protein [Sphingopyxis sp. C-1]